MKDPGFRDRPVLARAALTIALTLLIAVQACADILGRLHIVVKNADTEKPVADAKIVLTDSANVHAPIELKTDDKGSVITDPINARTWTVKVQAEGFTDQSKDVTVVADTTTDVAIDLETKEKTIRITAPRDLTKHTDTGSDKVHSKPFEQTIPVSVGNPQSLSQITLTNPGIVMDSDGQAHPRGDHSATSIYMNGFRLPGAFQGRAGQVLTPTSIQSLDLMTGSYAPEYGGETAAVLNLTLRSGPIAPFADAIAQAGSFGTLYGDVTIGGQIGQAYGLPTADGKQARRFGYLIDINGRQTDNALEPPQPDDQTAHNHGQSASGFGNFDYHASDRDVVSFTFNHAPATTQVANRTGLPDSYAPYGQGYGYGGNLTRAEAEAMGIGTQQADGQDINQRDVNTFGVVSWRRDFGSSTSSILSVGLVHSGLDVTNNNPAVDVNNLPADNSIEFNPTIIRNAHDFEVQGSVTKAVQQHSIKIGFNLDSQNGRESYQLIPASDVALQALQAIDPRLVPSGGVTPTLFVHRSGYYNAAYAQDTWQVNNKTTLNYGLRLDMYRQSSDATVSGGGAPDHNTVDLSQLSPRINLSYLLASGTVARASFNRLFIVPPQAEGSILGSQIKPETLSQYEVSLERQLAPGQVVKAAAYYKDIRNQIDTGLLVPGTQIGVFTSVNLDKGSVHGFELSYDLVPRRNFGWSGYASWTNSIARPGGLDNTGAQVDRFNDHDQLNTIALGGAYTTPNGYSFGANLEYGSGLASSVLADGSARHPHSEVNLQASTRPDLIAHRVGFQIAVENLLDSRSIINFNSGFSGTRFQQGRRILVSIMGKY